MSLWVYVDGFGYCSVFVVVKVCRGHLFDWWFYVFSSNLK